MSGVKYLPLIYQIAVFLGYKVEGFIDGKWLDIVRVIPSHKTKIRIDCSQMQKEKLFSLVKDFYDEMDYDDIKLLVPKDIPVNSIMIGHVGLGVFFKLDEKRELIELDYKEYVEKYKNGDIEVYHAYYKESFFDMGYDQKIECTSD
jgi:hypothetical protein